MFDYRVGGRNWLSWLSFHDSKVAAVVPIAASWTSSEGQVEGVVALLSAFFPSS